MIYGLWLSCVTFCVCLDSNHECVHMSISIFYVCMNACRREVVGVCEPCSRG